MKNLFLTTTICLIGLSTLAQTPLYENLRFDEIAKGHNKTAVQGQDKILSSLNNRNLKYISSQEFPFKRNLQFNQPFLSILIIQDSIDFFKKGYIDGGTYYMDTGPFWGGFATGFFIVFYGLPIIGTIIISRTPPSNLGNPNNPSNDLLSSNPQYYDGFLSGAKRKKSGNTWKGFAAGIETLAVIAVVSFLVLIASFGSG